jgi:TRAP-type C4-dicarboxylate transport system substrate-binding protein
VKIRTPEFEIPIGYWRALGARAVPVPFAELYTALETGVVDAAENSLAQTLSLKFYEPARNLTLSRHWFNFKPVRVNAQWFNGLPAEYQKCITDVGQEVFTRERQTTQDQDNETIEQLKKLDVTVHQPGDLAEWEKGAQTYTDRYLEKYPETREVVDKVRSLAQPAG